MIVLLGGSQAFGTGLAADEETVGAHLANVSGAQVLNAGIIGFASGQELALFATELAVRSPQVVVALTGWNDILALNQAPPSYGVGVNGFSQVEAQLDVAYSVTQANIPKRYLHGVRSVLFPQLANILSGSFGKAPLRAELKDVIEAFVRNEVLLDRYTRASGGKLLVALQPDIRCIEANGSSAATTYNSFRDAVAQRLRAQQIAVADTNVAATGLRSEDFMDPIHLNSAGNRKLAVFISSAVVPLSP